MDQVNHNHIEQSTALTCPDCGARQISTSLETREFLYGAGSEAVTLVAIVPVRHCGACGFEFTDREAEAARHEAVCRHLQVMTPREVRDLRELYGYSQATFAELTRLGEATISRWERGAVIQNQAYDNFLYLLRFADNVHRLQNRFNDPAHHETAIPQQRFKALQVTEHLRKREREFHLRIPA